MMILGLPSVDGDLSTLLTMKEFEMAKKSRYIGSFIGLWKNNINRPTRVVNIKLTLQDQPYTNQGGNTIYPEVFTLETTGTPFFIRRHYGNGGTNYVLIFANSPSDALKEALRDHLCIGVDVVDFSTTVLMDED
jgi:hypothetical protein